MDGAAAEHIREAVPVIASYGDAIGIRAFAERKNIEADMQETDFTALTDLIDTPYINMESAMNHPCQSPADWKTMDDINIPANGGKFVLSWAYHPRALPLAVPAATLHMAAKRGMDVTVLRPEGFDGVKDLKGANARNGQYKDRGWPKGGPCDQSEPLPAGTGSIHFGRVIEFAVH